MKEKLKEIIKGNDGFVVKEFNAFGNIYCIKLFENSQESLNIIKTLFSDYYTNSMMINIIKRTEEGYRKHLNTILDLNKKDGFSWYNVYKKNTNENVGVIGAVTISKGSIRFLCMFKLYSVVKPASEVLIKFFFENSDIKEIIGRTLSYNQLSQRIAKQFGMVETGFTICKDEYIRDSYLTHFVLTRNRYNEIKNQSKGVYKFLKVPRKTKPIDLHSKARTLKDAINEFNQDDNKERLENCKTLFSFLSSKYPRSYKK